MKYVLATFALLLTMSQVSIANAHDQECYPDPWEPAFTCFAHDAYGATGVSSSFNSQSKASARALASCQNKSSHPNTCHISSCRTPAIHCHDGNGNN